MTPIPEYSLYIPGFIIIIIMEAWPIKKKSCVWYFFSPRSFNTTEEWGKE